MSIQYSGIPRGNNEEANLLSHLWIEELEQLPGEVYIEEINMSEF